MRSPLCNFPQLRPALLLLLLPALLFARTNEPAVDAILTPLINAKEPGAAVLIRKNGHSIFARGYGVRDVQSSAPIDARTNFRLASFSKQFTAMAVMLLVRDKKLRYEQSLTEVFPGFPDYGRAITIRHLLNHTSGLMDYESLMEDKEKAQGKLWSPTAQIRDEDVLSLLAEQTSGNFPPGTRWSYSNSGYVVLGIVVAKASGMPFPEFLRRRIFKPLKMSHTVAYVNGQSEVRDRAYGYSRQDGRLTPSDQSATSATLGDGGIYSNLLDLARWDDALSSGRLLPAAEMRPALEPVKLSDGTEPRDGGKPVSYGFGWFLDPLDGRKRMWHTGTTSGFRTVVERFLDEKLTVVVLCNRTDLAPDNLAEKIASLKLP